MTPIVINGYAREFHWLTNHLYKVVYVYAYVYEVSLIHPHTSIHNKFVPHDYMIGVSEEEAFQIIMES